MRLPEINTFSRQHLQSEITEQARLRCSKQGDREPRDHSSPLIGHSLQPDVGHKSQIRHEDQRKIMESGGIRLCDVSHVQW